MMKTVRAFPNFQKYLMKEENCRCSGWHYKCCLLLTWRWVSANKPAAGVFTSTGLGELWCFTESLSPANASPVALTLSDSTATTTKYDNISNFISNENNVISCSHSRIGSVWLLLGLTIPELGLIHIWGLIQLIALQTPLSHMMVFDCHGAAQIPGRKESIFSCIKLRSCSEPWIYA